MTAYTDPDPVLRRLREGRTWLAEAQAAAAHHEDAAGVAGDRAFSEAWRALRSALLAAQARLDGAVDALDAAQYVAEGEEAPALAAAAAALLADA